MSVIDAPESLDRYRQWLIGPMKRGRFGDCSALPGCAARGVTVLHAVPGRNPALGADVTDQLLEESCANGRLENSLVQRKRQGFGM